MQTNWDVIFLGCSCFALGAASRRADDCLILEATEWLGPEFIEAMQTGPVSEPEGEALSFYNELIDRGIMTRESASRGEIHLPAVQMVLDRRALESAVHILFRTRLISIERIAEGFRLTAVCNAQMLEFTCRKVVDTRSEDLERIRRLDPEARFSLAASLYAPGKAQGEMSGMLVTKGFLTGESVVHLSVENRDPANREKLMAAFEQREKEWMDARLLLVAGCTAVRCGNVREEKDGVLFIPGCGYRDPVSAFAAGSTEKEVWA